MEIFVYADWIETEPPLFIGTLRASRIRGKEHFSFCYDKTWLKSEYASQIDPCLHLYIGEQHAEDDKNFKDILGFLP
nr:hypothetical protein [Salinivibrio costicola]